MKTLGVNIGTCGVRTVRLRPMLVFEEAHSEFLATKIYFLCDPARLTILPLTVPYLIESLDKALGSA